ncbi:MAG: hypothetical protein KDD23_12015, partial [Winogradskyella sp.]|nr:hypothetical protein [Winogradskyella sp.]
AQFAIKDKDQVLEYLNMPQVRALIPAEMRDVKFLFGKPEKESEIVDLYALVGNRNNIPPLRGPVVTDA